MLTERAALHSSLLPFVQLSAEAIKWPQYFLVHCDHGFPRAVQLLACFCYLDFSVPLTIGAPEYIGCLVC